MIINMSYKSNLHFVQLHSFLQTLQPLNFENFVEIIISALLEMFSVKLVHESTSIGYFISLFEDLICVCVCVCAEVVDYAH